MKALQDGKKDVDAVLESLRSWPYEDLGFARVDHHRSLRRGFPEVIFGEGKSVGQIVEIMKAMLAQESDVLVTRVDGDKAKAVQKKIKKAVYDDVSRTLTVRQRKASDKGKGLVLVLAAGTSDIPVAEEAAITAEMVGSRVERLFDVGVAGLHRLLDHFHQMRQASVLVVVAGMEGALPSVHNCRAHQCGLRRFIQGAGSSHGHAQLLRSRGSCGKHRQRLRRRLPRSPD